MKSRSDLINDLGQGATILPNIIAPQTRSSSPQRFRSCSSLRHCFSPRNACNRRNPAAVTSGSGSSRNPRNSRNVRPSRAEGLPDPRHRCLLIWRHRQPPAHLAVRVARNRKGPHDHPALLCPDELPQSDACCREPGDASCMTFTSLLNLEKAIWFFQTVTIKGGELTPIVDRSLYDSRLCALREGLPPMPRLGFHLARVGTVANRLCRKARQACASARPSASCACCCSARVAARSRYRSAMTLTATLNSARPMPI
ncbi:hypothetical protein HNQ08_005419 [Deinococcus humi]|uniref:Uncharacterized protein n=1 Tax=Deinococcus humi TaxID=662880 RepID=A0A7W8JZW1_9DEIO|nr:hypothetical protein [Deinococcus humi]